MSDETQIIYYVPQLLISQDYEDIEYITRNLIEVYVTWGLKLKLKKVNYMAVEETQRKPEIEDRKEMTEYVKESPSIKLWKTRIELLKEEYQ